MRGGRASGLAAAMLAGALCGLPRGAGAVPACPTPVTLKQPDGREIRVRLRGDEFLHWHEDERGFTVVRNDSARTWVYAVRDAAGRLAPGTAVVGRDDPEALKLPRRLLPSGGPQRAAAAAAARDAAVAAPLAEGGRAPAAASMKNLVVLVQFPDKPATRTRAEYEALFNQVGYATDGAQGSVRDYYTETSYGALTVESVVADWVTLDNGYAYYGANDAFGNDVRPREMVQEALAKLEARGFDFSTLDADGDGWVDGLDIIHSGGGEEYSGNDANYIWSHQWQMLSTVTYDGKSMRNYHTEPERRGWDAYPSTWGLTRIGVICHETGHFLGLPDLYDYGYDSEGAGEFCLMAGGSWNGDSGTLPAHMSAWCKKDLGWVVPTTVIAEGTYTLPRIETTATAYQLQGAFPSTQYFLVENRQGYGFDAGLPGSSRGLLIWHVDETIGSNDDQTHYHVDLEEASGTQHLELNQNAGDDADYYRQGNNVTFSSNSTPNNLSYASAALGLNVVGVSATGASMTFTVGAVPVNRFAWSAIASPQTASVPFPVTLTAQSSFGGLAPGFSGTAGLSGTAFVGVTNLALGAGTTGWIYPMSASYHDCRVQTIYLKSEVGAARSLTALALDVSTLPGQTLTRWTVRMKHTTLSAFASSAVWETGWTTCCQTNLAVGQTGWVTFPFTTPFAYNGTDNLMVDFSFNNSSASTDGQCRYTSPSTDRRSLYARANSTAGDPLGWPTNGFNPTRSRSVQTPNVKLFTPRRVPVAVSPAVSGAFSGGTWSGSLRVLEPGLSAILKADDGAGHTGLSGAFDVISSVSTVSLAVASAYGMASPAVGTHLYASGSQVVCAVTNSPLVLRDSRSTITCVCTGWTGTGSVSPPTGAGTSVSFAIASDSTLTWRWVVTDVVVSNQTVATATNVVARDTVTGASGYTVTAPGNVSFQAGKAIRLAPGFAARTGSVFRARIAPP